MDHTVAAPSSHTPCFGVECCWAALQVEEDDILGAFEKIEEHEKLTRVEEMAEKYTFYEKRFEKVTATEL